MSIDREETLEARRLIARINRRLRPESQVRVSRGERMLQTCGTWHLHNWQYNYIERYLPSIRDLRALADEVGCGCAS